MKTNRIVEVAVKVIVAALTAFLTAITTTSCMGPDCGVRLNDIYLILFSSFAGSRLMSHISTTWMVSDDSE